MKMAIKVFSPVFSEKGEILMKRDVQRGSDEGLDCE
jgi:hypothetical protein